MQGEDSNAGSVKKNREEQISAICQKARGLGIGIDPSSLKMLSSDSIKRLDRALGNSDSNVFINQVRAMIPKGLKATIPTTLLDPVRPTKNDRDRRLMQRLGGVTT